MSNKIPTAEELYYQFKGANINISKKQFVEAVKHSNKLHVKAALKAAAKNYRFNEINVSDNPDYLENKILNSYPEDLIQ